MPVSPDPGEVARRIVAHFRALQRDLPWRRTRDPYAIWISEIMLQQTRVAAVIPYYQRWMARFPTVRDLAQATLDEVLAAWAGLGYYSRARNLHRCSQAIAARHGGVLPDSAQALRALPGIGRYTAGAIASIAFGHDEPVVDGNVARVLARIYEIELDIRSPAGQRVLWELAGALLPAGSASDFNQGMMELGAMVCTPARPSCLVCPVRDLCRAQASGRQDGLPVRPASRLSSQLTRIEASALWITQRGQLLLARRAPRGLYGGLWELPQTEDASQLETLIPRPAGGSSPAVRLAGLEPMLEYSQILSHRQLRIRVFRAAPAGPLPRSFAPVLARDGGHDASSYDAFAWHTRKTLGELGLSSATQNIIDQIAENHGWNARKHRPERRKRSTSLPKVTPGSSPG